MEFINLKKQYALYKKEIDGRISKVLDSAGFILGPEVKELETLLAEYVGVKHAVALSSGTDALLAALMAYDIKPGEEIITTPFTFIATAEVISLLGLKPVFTDIDEKTFNINPLLIEEKITKKTRGIIPVSLFGQCAEFDSINKVAKKHGLFVIEDGCQSFGAEYKGRRSCSLTDIGTTSFFPSKPLGCYGDGGMVFTDNADIAGKTRMIANHGQKERYRHEILGINGRLDTVQAAVLLAKFAHFPEAVKNRIEKGKYYSQKLKEFVSSRPGGRDLDSSRDHGTPAGLVGVPYIEEHNSSVYAQYTIRTEKRDELAKALNKKGIPTAIHYPVPLHLQAVFSGLGYSKNDFPAAEKAANEVLSLPFSPEITQEEQDTVIACVKEFFS